MAYDKLAVCRVPGEEDQLMIILLDRQSLQNPFMETSKLLSRDEAFNALREMGVPENQIGPLVDQAKPCT